MRFLRVLPVFLIGLSPLAFAADHVDSPAVVAEPTADISDLYAWTSSDATKINVILNVNPFAGADAKFSNVVQYVITFNSSATYGATGTTTNAICTFTEAQVATCWVGNDNVSGNASLPAGINSFSGKIKLFAGLRNDPFFFNLTGFQATTTAVHNAAASLSFDTNGCPSLDENTATALVTQLATGTSNAAPVDNFSGANVLSIVLQIDKTLVNSGGDIIGISASTRK